MSEEQQPTTNRDISEVVGGSARTIYESSQKLVHEGKLDKSKSLSRTNQFHAPFDYLYVQEGFNIREKLNPARIRMFAECYKAGKFVPALVVIPKNGRFQVLDGHHRYYGAKIAIEEGAQLARLDLEIFEGDERDAILRMMNAAESERLTALDKASGYLRLRRSGMTVEEIAEARNQSTLQIKKMLLLANAPVEIKDAVRELRIKASPAIELLSECERTGKDPVALLNAAMQASVELGKGSVTPKAIKTASNKPKPLPRKHVDKAITTLMSSAFTTQLRNAVPADVKPDDNGMVELKLPATDLMELLAALEELEKAKAKNETTPEQGKGKKDGEAENSKPEKPEISTE